MIPEFGINQRILERTGTRRTGIRATPNARIGNRGHAQKISRARDLLQIAVLKTNPVFPFSWLNRAPYRLALNQFERLCRKFPEVRGVYLRHGVAQSGWVPGISDIDLTVTYARGLPACDEFRFLRSFRESVVRLRRAFPMLVDVEILDEELLTSFTRFGIRSLDTTDWKVLSGPPVLSCRDSQSATDRIDDALGRFFEYLLPWYSEPPTYLGGQRMWRAASRIVRNAPEDVRQPLAKAIAGDPALLVTQVLLALDQWIAREAPDETAVAEADEESVLRREETCLLVLGPKRDEEQIRRAIIRHRDRFSGRPLRVVTPRVLRYWMRVWQPRQYYDWKEYAEQLNGPDVLSRIAPPDEDAYRRGLLHLTHHVLSFPQREDLLVSARPEWFAGEAFRWMAIRGSYLRLYLEMGFHSTRTEEVMMMIARCYPDELHELEQIAEAAREGSLAEETLRFRGFRLLKNAAEAVNRALSDGRDVPSNAAGVGALCPQAGA